MSTAISPWSTGLKSCVLGISDFCGIFCCIAQKSCF
jgi:hypothetical protein